MSRIAQSNGDDHPEAARKHLIDAKNLLPRRADGAAYLSGYVVECVMKTILLVEGQHAPVIHHLRDLVDLARAAAFSTGARTSKYVTRATFSADIVNISRGWRATIRYRREGFVAPATANVWLNEADALYKQVMEPLWLDGVL